MSGLGFDESLAMAAGAAAVRGKLFRQTNDLVDEANARIDEANGIIVRQAAEVRAAEERAAAAEARAVAAEARAAAAEQAMAELRRELGAALLNNAELVNEVAQLKSVAETDRYEKQVYLLLVKHFDADKVFKSFSGEDGKPRMKAFMKPFEEQARALLAAQDAATQERAGGATVGEIRARSAEDRRFAGRPGDTPPRPADLTRAA